MWYVLGGIALLLILLFGYGLLKAAGMADDLEDAMNREERSRPQPCGSAPLTQPGSNETLEERA